MDCSWSNSSSNILDLRFMPVYRYPMVKKFRRYLYSFWRDLRPWQTDRRTPGDSKDRAHAYASRVKNRRFHVPQPTFLFPLETPLWQSRNMLHGWKGKSMLTKPSQHIPTYLQQFPSYTMLNSMRKSKNRYFYHIFVSPGDAPGAITLSVVWMERKSHAYKLSRCVCPSSYNCFWDRARYLWKNRHFIIPPCIRRPR